MFRFTYKIEPSPATPPGEGGFLARNEYHGLYLSKRDRLGCDLANFIKSVMAPSGTGAYLVVHGPEDLGEKRPLAIYLVLPGYQEFGQNQEYFGLNFEPFSPNNEMAVFQAFTNGQEITLELIPR